MVSVVIPVKDGERYLAEILTAVEREGADEVVVIDSGSRDRSPAIARAAGAQLVEIPPSEFGHGRTRNLGAELTHGELICFLTQDATPVPGWLAAYREAFAIDERVGAAFGPHLPRPQTSPMIARELQEFFAGFSPEGKPAIHRKGDPHFLSNVNACYRRECWEEVRFRDLPYAEDQAFGRDMIERGWWKVYHPQAAVLHAHDYPLLTFMRRYFDEYRGLYQSTGHREPLATTSALRETVAAVARDYRWMVEHNYPLGARARWAVRSFLHHGGRRVFAPLGSRADRLPIQLQRLLSLEGTAAKAGAGAKQAEQTEVPQLPQPLRMPAKHKRDAYEEITIVRHRGPVPLEPPVPGMADRDRLRIAMLIPPFAKGSGGHNTLLQILTRLEQRGHTCSLWLVDLLEHTKDFWAARLRGEVREFFAPFKGPFYKDLKLWQGADVVIATGWQTVHAALSLPRCRCRVYIVNDHEPEFFPSSVESFFAADTYRAGLYCIAASPWLRDLLIDRYGAVAESFELGVDHTIYRPLPVERRPNTVIYYARHATPRRATPIGLITLSEVYRRRPRTRFILFGSPELPHTAFPYDHLPVLSQRQLAVLYNQATVGLCLSLTNFSLMPKEMLACGLPCVELAGISAESIFGKDGGPLELAPLDPYLLAQRICALLDDRELWERRSEEGKRFVADHTWDRATDEVEGAIRRALRLRERELPLLREDAAPISVAED